MIEPIAEPIFDHGKPAWTAPRLLALSTTGAAEKTFVPVETVGNGLGPS